MELTDFASRAALEAEDNAMVAMIHPLPADVVPSQAFQEQTRVRLLQLIDTKTASARQAA